MYKKLTLLIVAMICLTLFFASCDGDSLNNKNESDTVLTTASNEETTAEVTEATTLDTSALVASVEVGMTYAEVVAILGESGPDIGSGVCMYEWVLSDGSVWRGSFQQQGDDNSPPEDWVLFNFDLVE